MIALFVCVLGFRGLVNADAAQDCDTAMYDAMCDTRCVKDVIHSYVSAPRSQTPESKNGALYLKQTRLRDGAFELA